MSAPDPSAFNPYSAPPATSGITAENHGKRLATRGERLLSTVLDSLIVFTIGTAIASALVALDLDPFPRDIELAAIGVRLPSAVTWHLSNLVPALFQWGLIATSGQSLGKKIVRLRIALADGSSARLLHGVVLRSVPLHVIALVPLLVQVAGQSGTLLSGLLSLLVFFVQMADVLFIFDSSYRCLHDRIAGTWVVSLRS